jgi:hypothetical protein
MRTKNQTGNAMGNFFGNVDNQSIDTMNMMGNGWLYAFFIIGVCLLLASWLVSSQVKRIQRIMARVKAEEEAARGNTTSEPPKV